MAIRSGQAAVCAIPSFTRCDTTVQTVLKLTETTQQVSASPTLSGGDRIISLAPVARGISWFNPTWERRSREQRQRGCVRRQAGDAKIRDESEGRVGGSGCDEPGGGWGRQAVCGRKVQIDMKQVGTHVFYAYHL